MNPVNSHNDFDSTINIVVIVHIILNASHGLKNTPGKPLVALTTSAIALASKALSFDILAINTKIQGGA